MKLLVATQNQGKLVEMQAALTGVNVELLLPSQVGLTDFDVEETGTTFAENARLKAVAFSQESGLSALADDSGLMVKALGGAPGVYSKRLIPGSDQDRNRHLLELLAEAQDRSAEFITVLCFVEITPTGPEEHYFEGRVSGRIGFEERGSQGFGYDPVFVPEGFDKTFAELSVAAKQELSHRGRALAHLKTYFNRRNS